MIIFAGLWNKFQRLPMYLSLQPLDNFGTHLSSVGNMNSCTTKYMGPERGTVLVIHLDQRTAKTIDYCQIWYKKMKKTSPLPDTTWIFGTTWWALGSSHVSLFLRCRLWTLNYGEKWRVAITICSSNEIMKQYEDIVYFVQLVLITRNLDSAYSFTSNNTMREYKRRLGGPWIASGIAWHVPWWDCGKNQSSRKTERRHCCIYNCSWSIVVLMYFCR